MIRAAVASEEALAGGLLLGAVGSVFFRAPRRSASRGLSPCTSFSSFTGTAVRSGSRPYPWICLPVGVVKRAVVKRMAPLPGSGITLSIELSPKV